MKKSATNRVISLLLVMLLVITQIPVTAMPVYAQNSGCTHQHDESCAYTEGAECTHECGEDCAEGCIHTEHDGACGYIADAPCKHEHDEDCGDLTTPTDAVTVLGFSTSGQALTVPLGTSYGDLPLPENLSATVEGEPDTADIPVAWTDEDGYDGDIPGDYGFTGQLGAGYILADGVTPPIFTVTVKADAASATESTIIFDIPINEYGETSFYLPEGVPVTDDALLSGVSAADENGGNVTVTVSDADGLDFDNPQMRGTYPNPPYIITYAAEHPVSGELFTVTRELYITLGAGDIMPLANSAGIISQITNYNRNHGGTGSLTATVSEGSRVVTVTGTVTGATNHLYLNIDAGVTVRWQANASGSVNSPPTYLVSVNGNGRFEMTAGDISNNYDNGIGIFAAGSNVTISGGTVSGSRYAVSVSSGGTLIVSGTGNLTSTYCAIYVDDSSSVTVSGGDISGGTTGIDVNGGELTVTGGSVAGNSNRGIWVHNGGTVNIGGSADIRSSQGMALAIQDSSTAHISGGFITGSATLSLPAATIDDNSELYMTGGTISTTGESNSALRVASESRAYISGGTLRNTSSTNSVIRISNNSVASVTGGTVDGTRAFEYMPSSGMYGAVGYLSSVNTTGNAAWTGSNRGIIVKVDAYTNLTTSLHGTPTGLTAYSGANVSVKWVLNGNGLLDIEAVIQGLPLTITIPMGLVPSALASSIIITSQPVAETDVTEGAVSGALSVAATVTPSGTPQYQWYQSHTNTNIGGTVVGGATSNLFTIPAGLTAGTYYYYCRVSAGAGAVPVNSRVAVVRVAAPAVINTTLVSAVANGYANFITTTLIRLTFSEPIYALTKEDIRFTSARNWTPGEVTGSGTEWAVRIDESFTNSETITVAVQPPDCNVTDNAKTVTIHWGGNITKPALNSATANGVSGTTTSSVITLQFSDNVYGLEKEDITITGSTGSATVTGLTGSGQTWYVSISDVIEGNISLNVRSTRNSTISGGSKTVAVYRGEASAGVYSVVINVNKDNALWNGHGMTVTLRQGENAPIPAEGEALLSASAPNGVYAVWADGEDTGVSVTVSDGPASAALNYYTIAFKIYHRVSGADRSTVYATYNGEPLHLFKSGGGDAATLQVSATEESLTPLVVLGGGILTVRCVGAGANNIFTYKWSGTASGSPTTQSVYTITVNAAVNGQCSIGGQMVSGNYISDMSVKTQPQLEYFEGDTLDLSALVAEVTRGGATTYVAYDDFDTNGILVNYEGGGMAAHGDKLTAAHNGKAITLTYYTDQYENTAVTITAGTLIVKADVSGSIVFAPGSKTYTGAALDCAPATVSGVSGGVWTYTYEVVGGGAELSGGKPLTAGTYKVTAAYTASDSWGTAIGIFTVNPKTLTAAMIADISPQDYTGSQIMPAVTVTDGALGTLAKDTDYTVSYGANINVTDGGSVTVTGIGNYTGAPTKTFTVNKADPAVTWPSNLTAGYGDTLADVDPNSGNGSGAGTFAWTAAGTTAVGAVGNQTHNLTFTPTDTNYKTLSQNVTISVSAKDISGATVIISGTYTYTGSAITPPAANVTVIVGSNTLVNGTDYTYTVTSGGTAVGTATVTVSGQNNYTGTVTQTFEVVKASQSAPAAPVLDGSPTAVSVTVKAPNGVTASMQFACKTGTGAPVESDWQPNGEFSGLDPNTEYSFYMRLAETGTNEASPASPALAVTTEKAALEGTPTISNTSPKFGDTLTAQNGTLAANPVGDMGALSYEWKNSGGSTVLGTGATYTVQESDIGKTIAVTVTTANCTGSQISLPTSAVAKADGPAAPTVTGSYTGDGTTFTYTANAITGAEYSKDGASWQDSNIFTGFNVGDTITFYARLKETATHKAGAGGDTGAVTFAKLDGQTTPPAFTMTYAYNSGTNSFTVTIPTVTNGEYSFDGITYTSTNTTTANPGEFVTGSVRYKETTTHDASLAAVSSLTLPVPVTSITVTGTGGADSITAGGGTLQMLADVQPAGAIQTVTWSISNGSGANISGSGLLTATGNGTVTVRATADDGSGVYGEKTITITGQTLPTVYVSSVNVSSSGSTISTRGGTMQMSASVLPTNATNKTVTWSISNGSGANINSSGLLTATANGTVTVRATANDGSGVYGEKTIAITNQTSSGNNGNNSGNGGGGGVFYTPTTPTTTTTPATTAKQPDMPALAKVSIKGTVKDKVMTASTITEKMAKNAIANLKDTGDGIAVQFNVKGSGDYKSLSVTFERAALEALKAAGVKYVQIGSTLIDLTLDAKAIAEILAQTTGNVTVSAMRQTKLSDAAKAYIGSRPVFDITIKDSKGAAVSDLKGGTATIDVAYNPTGKEKTGGLYGVYVDKNGKPQLLTKSSYDNGRLIFKRGTLSVYGVGYKAPAPAFTDTTSHWAKDDIDFVASRGLISGTASTTFSPGKAITRADFLMALGKLAGSDMSGYTTSSFTDVANTNPAMPYIEWAVQNKIVQGIGNNQFGPDRLISREQMAVMMVNYAQATGYTLPVSRQAITFADDAKISAYAKDAVKAIQQTGVINGKTGNLFDPQGNATRAEASTILRRFVELVIDEGTARGWVRNDSGQWQYISTNGKAVTGWQTIGGNKYFFDQNGVKKTGWHKENGKTYYLDKSGVMASGKWVQIGDKWYYFNADGTLAVNTTIDGYEVGADGARK